eukprot:SAG11_NODE_649_length_7940_cov_12.287973_7_plen_349_part_00
MCEAAPAGGADIRFQINTYYLDVVTPRRSITCVCQIVYDMYANVGLRRLGHGEVQGSLNLIVVECHATCIRHHMGHVIRQWHLVLGSTCGYKYIYIAAAAYIILILYISWRRHTYIYRGGGIHTTAVVYIVAAAYIYRGGGMSSYLCIQARWHAKNCNCLSYRDQVPLLAYIYIAVAAYISRRGIHIYRGGGIHTSIYIAAAAYIYRGGGMSSYLCIPARWDAKNCICLSYQDQVPLLAYIYRGGAYIYIAAAEYISRRRHTYISRRRHRYYNCSIYIVAAAYIYRGGGMSARWHAKNCNCLSYRDQVPLLICRLRPLTCGNTGRICSCPCFARDNCRGFRGKTAFKA